jgi:hypothetical protein
MSRVLGFEADAEFAIGASAAGDSVDRRLPDVGINGVMA